ncbi:MAG: CAP domain-containing protein [Croceibacterium sp.]
MRTGSLIAGALACALAFITAAGADAQRRSAANPFAEQLLARHNMERDRKGVQRLAWSRKLAQEAQGWADRLAIENTMRHADHATRGGAGENLWMGSAGHFGAEQMIDGFLAERQQYRPGAFPDVSRTGRWEDVGHYTQIIWPGTQEVGCAVARNANNDFLVCRYWPAGNTVGVRID